jgi:hypothetical protein
LRLRLAGSIGGRSSPGNATWSGSSCGRWRIFLNVRGDGRREFLHARILCTRDGIKTIAPSFGEFLAAYFEHTRRGPHRKQKSNDDDRVNGNALDDRNTLALTASGALSHQSPKKR